MHRSEPSRDALPTHPFRRWVYVVLLREAKQVSGNALARLRRLQERYPSSVPLALVERMERSHDDPWADRRLGIRLNGGPPWVQMRVGADGAAAVGGQILDRSAGGLAVRLAEAVPAGAVVAVRWPGGSRWFPAVVRHCDWDGDGWAVGCEFIGERPPA